MIVLQSFIEPPPGLPDDIKELTPWRITGNLPDIVLRMIEKLDNNYIVKDSVAIHISAVVEGNSVIKGPAIIGKDCFVAMNVLLRGGIILETGALIGPGCEIKASIIGQYASLAHFNYIGDSIIGNRVNFEAGSVIANHYNERKEKGITISYQKEIIETGVDRFGALVGDDCRIGANAVLSPGTLLPRGYIVKRLELIEQVKL